LLGQIVIEERDFDIPRGLGQVFDPRAWRGGGKTFRLEAMPGQDVQRYLISLSNPYFRGTDNSLSVSGYLFDRQFFDWDEERLGGRVNFETRLDQYLSVSAGLRMESVTIDNPRLMASPQLNATLGNSNLFLGTLGLVYDNRIDPVSTKVGSYLGLKFSQAFGDYSYSRGEVDFQNHRLIYARPDQSGAHTLSYKTKLGFTGGSTPVFENFFAGGFSSMRGFDFRGVSPIENGVRVGGEFQWLNTLEYKFPLSADDFIHGVTFIDFGTVEESVELNSENFRVAPGLGLRVNVPFAGTAAPLAFDFAFPISTATGDDEKLFSFYIGLIR
jgi:outer membrane protein insertion porin family